MPGRPVYREAVKRIEEAGGEEYVLHAVMDGASTSAVAAVCDVSRGMLYEWLHKDAERWERYQQAREIGAHSQADEAQRIADSATSFTIGVDRERIRVRQWLAERANKRDFGKADEGAKLVLSVGELHLQAVQSVPQRAQVGSGDAQVPEAEYEVLPSLEDLL